MTEEVKTSCVLIPCADEERWAVPQSCLAEIHVINSIDETPPNLVIWRGQEVPVVDFGGDNDTLWCERRVGTGIIAIFLGLKGGDCEYWGVAVRGAGLDVVQVASDEVEDASGEKRDYASAAFKYNDLLYQVPDLNKLQEKVAADRAAA